MNEGHPERARRVLREVFGHESFRPLQEDVITHVLAGGDACVLLPTGGGKSLLYQIPALIFDGLTVVLSPLIALMEDQTAALRRRGVAATFINSSLDREERERRLRSVRSGETKILYAVPERFRQAELAAAVRERGVSLLAVDEAHCVTSWGHDFRPEYGRIARIRTAFGNPPTIALTATATPDTVRAILEKSGIPNARVFHGGLARPNLFLSAVPAADGVERDEHIVRAVGALGGSGIVYFALIRDLARVEDLFRRRGMDPLVYHGDLTASERKDAQRAFMDAPDRVCLATNAFGLGIDKADIRFILHAQTPASLEAYWQEAGRAGRDGGPSLCEVHYAPDDLMIHRRFIEWANPDAAFLRSVHDLLIAESEKLSSFEFPDLVRRLPVRDRVDGRIDTALALLAAEGVTAGRLEDRDLRVIAPLADGAESLLVDPAKERRDLMRLLGMVEWSRNERCKREILDEYFGVRESAGPCGMCDVCTPRDAWRDAHIRGTRARPSGHSGSGGADAGDAAAPSQRRDRDPARGDWIDLGDGRPCLVTRVDRSGTRLSVEVENPVTEERRTVDLSRRRWKKIVR